MILIPEQYLVASLQRQPLLIMLLASLVFLTRAISSAETFSWEAILLRQCSSKSLYLALLLKEQSRSMSAVKCSTLSVTARKDGQRFAAFMGTAFSVKANGCEPEARMFPRPLFARSVLWELLPWRPQLPSPSSESPGGCFAIRFHHGVLQFSLPGPPNVALTEGCMSLLSDNSLGAEICNFDLRVAQILQYGFSMLAEGRSPVAYFTGVSESSTGVCMIGAALGRPGNSTG